MHIDIVHSKPVEMLKYDYPSDIEAFHTTIQQIMTTARNMILHVRERERERDSIEEKWMKQVNKPQMLILACPCQYNPGVNPVKVIMNKAVMEDS